MSKNSIYLPKGLDYDRNYIIDNQNTNLKFIW